MCDSAWSYIVSWFTITHYWTRPSADTHTEPDAGNLWFFRRRLAFAFVFFCLKGTWKRTGFSEVFALIGSAYRSLTLHFEPFRFFHRILGDIRIGKTTPGLNDTGSR